MTLKLACVVYAITKYKYQKTQAEDCVRLPWWHTEKSFHQSWGKYSWCKDTQPHTIYMVSQQMVAWQHHSDPGWGLSTVVQPPSTQSSAASPRNSLLKFTRRRKLILRPLSWLLQTVTLFFPSGQSAFPCVHLRVSVIIWLRQEVSECCGKIRMQDDHTHPRPHT